jgi:hypothetical protein
VAVAPADLPQGARDVVNRHRVSRVARNIIWDISSRHQGMAPAAAVIQHKLATIAVPTGLATDTAVMAAVAMLADSVAASLPQPVTEDTSLRNTIHDDLLELCQRFAAIPKRLYDSLSLAPTNPAEAFSLSAAHTGMALIYSHLDKSLLDSQVQSFAIALVFIFLLLSFQLRSLTGGLLGLIPIVLTVVLVFGIMGFTGIPLDVATVLVASIALGIGIDYSIHFSIRFKSYYHGPSTARQAMDDTLRTTGKAIIINVLAVTMGFITTCFAELVPLQRFGLLVAITMIGSGLGALTLLPATILLTRADFVGRHSEKDKLLLYHNKKRSTV